MQRILTRLAVLVGLLGFLLGGVVATGASAADPTYRVRNNATGGSLLPQGYGNSSADGIYMYAWDPAYTYGGDQWKFEQSYNGYLIRNTKTGKCLKPGGPYYGKTYLTQGTCNHTNEFQWTAEQRNGLYKLTNVASRQVMTPYYGTGLGEVVVLEPDSNVAKVWWSIDQI